MKKISIIIALLGISTNLSAQNRLYVNQTAAGANNGQTWADAFTDLQDALAVAQAGDEVWVGTGTYYPTASTDRSISFEPKSGVKLYGGFAGNETTLDERDWTAQLTFLSGDIGISGDSTDNSLNVVYLFQSDSNSILDGLTICFGLADNLSGANTSRDRAICGGGLYIEAGNWDAFPNIQNCRFWRNTSNSYGGAVMTNGASAAGVAPRFVHCRFEENRSLGSGGGLARFGGSWAERGKEFEGCTFSHNRAEVHGGAIFYSDTPGPNTVLIQGCSFEGNLAANRGGGVYFLAGKAGKSGLYVQNCGFEANTAREGAAIDFFTNGNDFDGEAVIDSCVFLKNISPSGGNAPTIIYSDQFGTSQTIVRLSNSRLEANKSQRDIVHFGWLDAKAIIEGVVFYRDTSIRILRYSIISSAQLAKTRFSSNIASKLVDVDYYTPSNVSRFHCNNCLFDNNQSNTNLNCFILFDIDSVFFTNCTFADNKDEQFGSAHRDIVLNNVIMRKIPPVDYLPIGVANKYYFTYSFLDYPDCSNLPPNVICGPNNLFNLNPLFRDTAAGDYTLLPCSPLINAGSNAAATGIPTDLAGNPRIQEGTVDIGAYEAPGFTLATVPQVKPACAGTSNGSIAVNPIFGCEPYTYNWSPAAGNGPELNGLPPGNYLLTITDGSGRQILDTLAVESAPLPVLALLASDVQCGGQAGGSLSASVASGTEPFHYQWVPGAADTAHLVQQQPGLYALTVTDVNGCQDSASASIALQGLLTLTVDGQAIRCYGETGWLSATPSTGAAPFSWQWQGWPGTDSLAQPLGPGLYAVTVADAYGCTASFAFPPTTQPDSLWATVGTNPQTDLSMPNGLAVVTTISGGMQPFGFDWNTGSTMQSITNIPAGTYTVTITDKNGCETVNEVTVELMVGAGEVEGQALLLYPNPAVDWVEVVLPDVGNGRRLELLDASGRVIRQVELRVSGANYRLDLQGLPGGKYVLRVLDKDGTLMFIGKVAKQ